jgi:hypothetical protein
MPQRLIRTIVVACARSVIVNAPIEILQLRASRSLQNDKGETEARPRKPKALNHDRSMTFAQRRQLRRERCCDAVNARRSNAGNGARAAVRFFPANDWPRSLSPIGSTQDAHPHRDPRAEQRTTREIWRSADPEVGGSENATHGRTIRIPGISCARNSHDWFTVGKSASHFFAMKNSSATPACEPF